MNRPPKSSARKTTSSQSHPPAKAVGQTSKIKNLKHDTSRLGVRARATGNARGK